VKILDPSAELDDDSPDPGPDLDSLEGVRVGIRVDILWPSWDWVVDEWTESLEAEGASVETWRSRGRVNDEGDEVLKELEAFLGRVDACIVGLANCGSCTSWTIHDALAADARGLPTTAVVTDQFVDLAKALTRRAGRSGLRLHVLPYPLHTRPEEDVRDIAREQFRSVLRTLGVRDRLVDQSPARG
jgi:hypothetical protein